MRFHLAVAFLVSVCAYGAYGRAELRGDGGIPDIAPTPDAIRAVAADIAATDCQTPQCRAVVVIARAIDIVEQSTVTTMGITRPLPPNLYSIVERRWKHEVLNRREQYPVICDMMTNLAARSTGSVETTEHLAATSFIQIAARMDGKTGKCLASVLAAFPRTPVIDSMIEDARIECTYSWKQWTTCERIAR
jgi:hypothetical protein